MKIFTKDLFLVNVSKIVDFAISIKVIIIINLKLYLYTINLKKERRKKMTDKIQAIKENLEDIMGYLKHSTNTDITLATQQLEQQINELGKLDIYLTNLVAILSKENKR